MIPETENPQEVKRVCPGKPARYAYADPGRYALMVFSRYGSYISGIHHVHVIYF